MNSVGQLEAKISIYFQKGGRHFFRNCNIMKEIKKYINCIIHMLVVVYTPNNLPKIALKVLLNLPIDSNFIQKNKINNIITY